MSNGTEQIRLQGLVKPKSAAPRAWQNMVRVVTMSGPQRLSTASRARARIRAIR